MTKPLITRSRELFLIALIAVLSLGTHFYRFDYPQEIVFDELHFAGFISSHLKNTYYFDIHPPLAKELLAGFTKLVGVAPDPGFKYDNIGAEFTNKEFHTAIRLVVTFFGFLLPLLVFAFTRVLFANPFPALVAAVLAVFENSLIVHSRFILTDIFLLDFGILGLTLFLLARTSDRPFGTRVGLWIGAGLFLGAAMAVKWTALVFVGLAGLVALYDLWRQRRFQDFAMSAVAVLLTGFAVYAFAFALHFGALTKSGTGDAFMTAEFQSTLQGNANADNPALTRPNFWEKFAELNRVMFNANKGITADHSYGSDWYEWPFLGRSVYYWNEKVEDPAVIAQKFGPESTIERHVEERIYLLGNFVTYWTGFVVMLFLTFHVLVVLYVRLKEPFLIPLALVCIGYWVNLLPYAAIDRVSFLYHYFPSLVFLFAGVGFFCWRYASKKEMLLFTGIFLVFVVAAFAWVAPVTYGLPLTNPEFDRLMFLPNWK